ncbi:MAG: MOSC domain-containing protein [Phycisphaerales bacterium]|nr:MOSC domain-containing protein [Phycisphaerales bacterium]
MSSSHDSSLVARVAALWRYPVKSMAAEALNEADVSWQGIAGDRRWAFVRPNLEQSGFPWLTLRQRADMNAYRPAFTDPANPDTSPTRVRTPTGAVLDVTDPALAAELDGARIIRQKRGIFDAFPLALITTQTIAQLSDLVGMPLDPQRFRPNILIDAHDDTPFPEDAWVGRTVRIGGMRMRIDKRDGRCVVITIDPATGERRPEILKTVADHRQGCLGVYGSIVTPGRVVLGDEVVLEQ